MEKSRTKGGVHQVPTATPNKYTQDQLRLMKTQDIGYLNLKNQAEKKKIEKMQQSLHLLGATQQQQGRQQHRHVVFVDDEDQARSFDPEKHFDTPAELLDRTYNRPRTSQLEEGRVVVAGRGLPVSAAEKTKVKAYKELLQRQERQEALGSVAQRMEYEKLVMGRGRKRKITSGGGSVGGAPVFKWKKERKR